MLLCILPSSRKGRHIRRWFYFWFCFAVFILQVVKCSINEKWFFFSPKKEIKNAINQSFSLTWCILLNLLMKCFVQNSCNGVCRSIQGVPRDDDHLVARENGNDLLVVLLRNGWENYLLSFTWLHSLLTCFHCFWTVSLWTGRGFDLCKCKLTEIVLTFLLISASATFSMFICEEGEKTLQVMTECVEAVRFTY